MFRCPYYLCSTASDWGDRSQLPSAFSVLSWRSPLDGESWGVTRRCQTLSLSAYPFLSFPLCWSICANSWVCLWPRGTHALRWALTYPYTPLSSAQMNDQSFLFQTLWVPGTKRQLKTKVVRESESCLWENNVKQSVMEPICKFFFLCLFYRNSFTPRHSIY